MKRANSGFTLLELLLAAAMLGTLLALLAGLLQSTARAHETNEQLSFEQQSVEAASELLRYELGLAGYRGTDADYASAERDFSPPGAPPRPALEVTPDNKQVTVRFYEDRFQTAPKLNEIVFKIKSNRTALMRKVGGSSFQEVARGVTELSVTEFRLRNGGVSTQLPDLAQLSGLTVQLSFAGSGSRDIPVHFHNNLVAR